MHMIYMYNVSKYTFWQYYIIISLHKNKVEQKPGWHDDVLEWCLKEAEKKNLQQPDYMGGFILDEMKIQVKELA